MTMIDEAGRTSGTGTLNQTQGRQQTGGFEGSTGGNGARSGSDTLQQARDSVSSAAAQASTKVVSTINDQKARAADGLGSVAQALRQSSGQLRDQDAAASLHQLVSSAADQVDRLSGYMRSRSVSDMVSEVEQFARRQPAVFIGGALLLGLLGARFLKSSGRPDASLSAPRDATNSYGGSNTYTDPRTSQGYWSAQEGTREFDDVPARGSPTSGEVF